MAAQKPLQIVAGVPTAVTAVESSVGAGDEGKIVALNATGLIDVTMLPAGIGADTITAVASEALVAGNIVNVYSNAGTKAVRKADASSAAKYAVGFVLAAVANAATATIYLGGLNDQVTGLTPGVTQWLSAVTPGAVTATPPTTGISQIVGTSGSATQLAFEAQNWYVL